METDGANNRRHIESEEAVEAMDTQESDVLNEAAEIDNLSNNGDTNMQIAPPVADSTTTVSMDATTTDTQIEEEARAEANFSFRIENFSGLKESVLSPPCFVRNLPWKIMAMLRCDRNQPENRSLGFFLQCNGESESNTWSCQAVAELRLKSFKEDAEPFVRKIRHLFYSKENDWGFSFFMSWNDILDPEKGYIKDDAIVLEVHVQAEAPHGVLWDSKRHTGYVGLKNQGATCYMNSLLQTLYFTNQLRKAVYKMPTEADDSSKSVALALQRVFHDLQFNDKSVGTKKLTKSFGWETLDSFMQHDVQEFLRVLLDKLESKMKGTCVEGTVPKLFEGKMMSYIKCKNIEYKSTRMETFYDIQLNIKGKKHICESFDDYTAPETLEGDNKYDAGEHGFQEAEKGVKFVSFPPVLHLHLMRFQYDPITDNSVKFNDRFEFYETINLDKYLDEKESTPADYRLHAVLVHSGDNHGGHYVVYINPTGDGNVWCKFDDDVVAPCTKAEAIEQNYGGMDEEVNLNAKHCSNAYMLVYIRVSALKTVLQEITKDDIPIELSERLNEDKRMELVKRRERTDGNSCITIQVLLEDYFEGHQTTDLFDPDKVHYRAFRMRRQQPLSDFIKTLSETFKISNMCRMRIWTLPERPILRPRYFDFCKEMKCQLQSIKEFQNSTTIFLEILLPDCPHKTLTFNKDQEMLLFFKFYDPVQKRLNYVGTGQYLLQKKIHELIPELNKRMGFPIDTELIIYEENAQNTPQKLSILNDTLEKTLKASRDDVHSSVIIFEKRHEDEKLELPTCEDYIRDLLFRVEIIFIDKSVPNDPGFTLQLSQKSNYDQMATAVGQKINAHPYEIQFFKCNTFKEIPSNPLRCPFDGTLKDNFVSNKKPKKLFYQRLSMNIHELENKKQFKCLWLSSNLKDEKELVLYPNKNGTVKDLLDEAAKQIEFSDDSTRKLRLVEVSNHKIFLEINSETPLESLQSASDTMSNQSNQKAYRIEEIPHDELILTDTEMLIPVSHFYKDAYAPFGVPFLIKAKNGELYGTLKAKIQKKLNVPDKEWEKYKFAIISMGRLDYITDDNTLVSLASFKPSSTQPSGMTPSLGLDHINKSQKRSRYTYLEKAIKIYN